MKWLFQLSLFLLFLIAILGIAEATYLNEQTFGLGNGAYITVNTTTIDDVNQLACCDYGLMMKINGSETNYTAGTNKTITSAMFDNVTDVFTVSVSGVAGYINLSVIMMNASNSYSLYADGAFVSSKTSSNTGLVWFNYSMSTAKTLTVTWNTPLPSSPALTSNLNNITGDSVLDITLNINNAILFSAGANQTISSWSWGGATKINGDGTPNSTASKLFSSIGDHTVTVQGTNANGSTQVLTWTIHVITGGGQGTDWDYLTGTVNIAGATITTNPNVGSTTGGAYSFGYVFVDGQTYWINVSKTGYISNNTQITFNEDHEIWNPILTIASTTSSIYTVHYEYGCDTPSGNLTPEINIVYGMIIVVVIVVLLIIIVAVIQENPMMGIVIAGILVISSGAIYPEIIRGVYNAPLIVQGCSNFNEAINISGHQDNWMNLTHSSIHIGSQVVSNSTYTAVNNTDYDFDYSSGRIMPLSTGNMWFGS